MNKLLVDTTIDIADALLYSNSRSYASCCYGARIQRRCLRALLLLRLPQALSLAHPIWLHYGRIMAAYSETFIAWYSISCFMHFFLLTVENNDIIDDDSAVNN